MTVVAMQGADLLIRSDSALPIQATPQYFCVQPLVYTHIPLKQPSGQFGVYYLTKGYFDVLQGDPGIEPLTFQLGSTSSATPTLATLVNRV